MHSLRALKLLAIITPQLMRSIIQLTHLRYLFRYSKQSQLLSMDKFWNSPSLLSPQSPSRNIVDTRSHQLRLFNTSNQYSQQTPSNYRRSNCQNNNIKQLRGSPASNLEQSEHNLQARIQLKWSEREMQQRESHWARQIQYINKIKTNNERIYKNKIQELQRKIEKQLRIEEPFECEQRLVQQSVQIDNLSVRLKQLEKELASKEMTIHELIKELESVRFRLQMQAANRRSSEVLTYEQSPLYSQQKKLLAQNKELAEVNQLNEKTIQNLQNELHNMTLHIRNIDLKIEQKEQQLEESLRELSAVREELSQTHRESKQQLRSDEQQKLNIVMQQLELCKKQLLTTREKKDELQKMNSHLQGIEKMLVLKTDCEELQKQQARLSQSVGILEEQNRQNEETIFALERSNGALRKQLIKAHQYYQEREKKHGEELEKYKSKFMQSKSNSRDRSVSERTFSPASNNFETASRRQRNKFQV